MPEVTRLVERRGRAKVFVDGEYWAELDAATAAELGLAEGADLSDGELAEARIAGERPLAMARALNILGYRARSEGELRSRLVGAGYAGGTVEGVVERLRDLGYLDDGEFARNAAREKARRYGPRRVYGFLVRRGYSAGVCAEVAKEYRRGADE